jgi:DNA-directed RNA polymerase specialized sigma24 family protein
MQAAIARLDPADQDLLRQRLVMEYDEIAAQSGTAVGTLRVRHKRALDRLRREIGEG